MSEAEHAKPVGSQFNLTILGAATPYPRPDRACSGYLVRAGASTIWIDAGFGTLGNLLRHVTLDEVDAIWISHLHADHVADLLAVIYALDDGTLRRGVPIPILAPSGLAGRLAAFVAQDPSALDQFFSFNHLADGLTCEINGARLITRAVKHGLGMEAFGLRVEAGAAVLAFTGDSAPCDALQDLAAGADILLSEADALESADDVPQSHLTAQDAGALAREAGVAELLITHVGSTTTVDEAVKAASAAFGGQTRAAIEGHTYSIKSRPA